jgi:hypothetical protein
VAFVLGGGHLWDTHSPTHFNIALITSGWSIKLMIFIVALHLGQVRGSS